MTNTKAKATTTKATTKNASNKASKINKVVKEKLTKAQLKAKREANPIYSNLVSSQAKKEQFNAKAMFLEAKRRDNLISVDDSNKYDNAIYLQACKKFCNYALNSKNVDIFDFCVSVVRTTDKGKFVPYYFSQLIQRVVKITSTKNINYSEALHVIRHENNAKTEAKKAKK